MVSDSTCVCVVIVERGLDHRRTFVRFVKNPVNSFACPINHGLINAAEIAPINHPGDKAVLEWHTRHCHDALLQRPISIGCGSSCGATALCSLVDGRIDVIDNTWHKGLPKRCCLPVKFSSPSVKQSRGCPITSRPTEPNRTPSKNMSLRICCSISPARVYQKRP